MLLTFALLIACTGSSKNEASEATEGAPCSDGAELPAGAGDGPQSAPGSEAGAGGPSSAPGGGTRPAGAGDGARPAPGSATASNPNGLVCHDGTWCRPKTCAELLANGQATSCGTVVFCDPTAFYANEGSLTGSFRFWSDEVCQASGDCLNFGTGQPGSGLPGCENCGTGDPAKAHLCPLRQIREFDCSSKTPRLGNVGCSYPGQNETSGGICSPSAQ